MAEGGDKTEDATPKRREDSRKKGQVARSPELGTASVVLVGGAMLLWGAGNLTNGLGDVSRHYLNGLHRIPLENTRDGVTLMESLGRDLFPLVLPIFLACFMAAFFSGTAQVGLNFSFEALQPKFEKLNPLQGIKRMVGPQGIFDLVKNLAKVFLLGLVAWFTLKAALPLMVMQVDTGASGVLAAMADGAQQLVLRMLGTFGVIAAADYIWQRHRHEKSIKMSKQEVKDEAKQSDGDPYLKARVRSMMLEVSRRRMMDDVKTADVIITNPTHISVAIKYDPEEGIPKVVAKGKGFLAKRIREIAAENDIPRMEDKPLARALYRTVKVGEMIPAKLYEAVAQILAAVFRAKRARGGEA